MFKILRNRSWRSRSGKLNSLKLDLANDESHCMFWPQGLDGGETREQLQLSWRGIIFPHKDPTPLESNWLNLVQWFRIMSDVITCVM